MKLKKIRSDGRYTIYKDACFSSLMKHYPEETKEFLREMRRGGINIDPEFGLEDENELQEGTP